MPATLVTPVRRVAIVGGGASGVLTALHLLSQPGGDDVEVTVHESTGVLGRGIAYGTSDARHLLNVRSRHMSAYADVPYDFVQWARRAGRDPDPMGFVPRMDFAHYLQDTLASAADHRLTVRAGRVEDVRRSAEGFEVQVGGRATSADAVVLATGNQRPAPIVVDGVELTELPGHLADPWDLGAQRALGPEAVVVVVGAGLTAIDAAITLLEDAPERRVVMVSRRGELPQHHIAQQSTAWVTKLPAGELTADRVVDLVLEQMREARAAGADWRTVVDGLRPVTQEIWLRLSESERRRLVADHGRDWEVRRHRMAPGVAARIDEYRAQGRLRVVGGGIAGVSARGSRTRVDLADGSEHVVADAVVNCTGPVLDLEHTADPLLRRLRDGGLVAADPLRLGIAATPSGQVVDAAGELVPGLHAVGPLLKGVLWESTAIPEIRAQAARVAQALVASA